MKNIYCLLFAVGCSLTTIAQSGSDISRWHLGINAKGGVHSYEAEQINIAGNYANVVNPVIGEVVYTPGNSMGFDLQVGYFIGRKANFGLGVGLIYLKQTGDAALDKFHVEYESRDFNNDIYRQVINLKAPIAEEIKSTNINIPIVLKYRTKLSKAFDLNVDAGVVYNLSMRNKYTTNAAFDYESIYTLVRIDNRWTAVYNPSSDATAVSWRITQAEIQKTRPSEVETEFAKYQAEGYNVGLNEKPRATGYKSYKSGSIGFLVQPSVAFRLTDAVSINVGGYFMYQTFTVGGETYYNLTSAVGSYSSIMGAQKNVKMQNYGGSFGLGFSL